MAKHAIGRSPAPGSTVVLASTRTEMASVPGRYRRRSVSAFLVGATALGGAAFLPGLASAAPVGGLQNGCTQTGTTVTCTYGDDGGAQFVAPTGVTTFTVLATGASGGAGGATNGHTGGAGGFGKTESGTVTVGANRTFDIFNGSEGDDASEGGAGGAGPSVGGSEDSARGGSGGTGNAGASGGGGGGGTAITQPGGDTVVLVAGGGAGGGGAGTADNGFVGNSEHVAVQGNTPFGGPGQDAENDGAGAGGGGGGGAVGGEGAGAGTMDGASGGGGFAGSSTGTGFTQGTAATAGGGSVVITYQVPTTPPTSSTGVDLTATVDAPGTLAVGQDGTVTVTVTNNGTTAAQGVKTRVSIPSGLRIVSGGSTKPTETSIAPGATVTYTYEVEGTKERPRVPITAVTTSRTKDADHRDNHDTEYVAVTGQQAPPP